MTFSILAQKNTSKLKSRPLKSSQAYIQVQTGYWKINW